jgi:hypothetical protein
MTPYETLDTLLEIIRRHDDHEITDSEFVLEVKKLITLLEMM